MDQVHDIAADFIKKRLVKDTIEKFTKFLQERGEKTIEEQHGIISLDPSSTHHIFPPAFMVAIGSVAGAGKTSLSKKIGQTLSAKCTETSQDEDNKMNKPETMVKIDVVISQALVLPMDGYHRYRSELSAMKDPEEAFRRRGAPFTFNDEKYAANMIQLRQTGKLSAPEFDHAKKDPEEDAIQVNVMTSYSVDKNNQNHFTVFRPLVIVEGIYCLYDDGDFWEQALSQYDERIYLKINIDNATERLTKRHMRAWNISEAEARVRAAGSDRDNGLLVIARAEKLAAAGRCLVLESVEDEEFAMKLLK